MPHHPFYFSARWKQLRKQILRRDNYSCVKCGAFVGAPGAARVDHIERLRDNPSRAYDPANLRTLCGRCDINSHREMSLRVGHRVERTIHGNDETGFPRDADHPWNRSPGPIK
jgi:5-methylcytosine-specific restriction endonuclease McrA